MSISQDGKFEYGETIATPVGLLSYPQVWQPAANDFKAGKEEFSCMVMIPKAGADLTTILNESLKPVKRLFGDSQYHKLSDFGSDHCPIKNGDAKGEDHPQFGYWVIKATASPRRRPFVLDAHNRPITDQEEIYGGAIGQLWVQPMAYAMKMGKGVKFFLVGVQKIADGKPFGRASFNPATAGYKAPEVPDYLKSHHVPSRMAVSAPAASSADQAMKRALATNSPAFNGDVDDFDSETPF